MCGVIGFRSVPPNGRTEPSLPFRWAKQINIQPAMKKTTFPLIRPLAVCLALAIALVRTAVADLVGPYTPDANTLFLLHFDEAAGGTVTTNVGSKGGKFYSVDENPAALVPPTITTLL